MPGRSGARRRPCTLDHDLAPRVLAAIPASVAQARRDRRPIALRAGLLAALVRLAITVPLLILGHDHDAGVHAAHELGSFDLALAAAFAVDGMATLGPVGKTSRDPDPGRELPGYPDEPY
jgi:hypothetical protein